MMNLIKRLQETGSQSIWVSFNGHLLCSGKIKRPAGRSMPTVSHEIQEKTGSDRFVGMHTFTRRLRPG